MIRQAAVVTVLLGLLPSPLHAQSVVYTVTIASANVHSAPSTGATVIGKAPRGQSFEVTRELGSWVRVPWPDGRDGVGYLHVTWGTISRGRSPREDVATAASAPPQAPSLRPRPQQAAQTTGVPVGRPPVSSGVPAPTVVSLPSHLVGLGGRLGTGVAATGRAWSRGPLGVQLEFGRSTRTSTLTSDHLSTVQFAPSVIYSTPNVVTNALWIRPYLGTGLTIHRSTLNVLADVADAPTDKGVGYQAFGGAEFTFAGAPQLAVSADLRKHWASTPFDGFDLGGFGVSISGHWYVK